MKHELHDLSWMLSDALSLLHLQRKYSAILILLCAVDAIAARRLPNKDVRGRFEEFLRIQMRRPGRAQIHNIFVPSQEKLLTFEYILYKYLRNPFVHEGALLELDSPNNYAVQIDWTELPRGVKVDSDNNRIILGGEMIIDILLDAVSNGLKENIN
jgi:hypothetical protein